MPSASSSCTSLPRFLQATEHIVEPCHHFLPFLWVEIDANAIVTFQQVRRPFDLRSEFGKLMSLQKRVHLCFGYRRKLILMKLLYICRHRLAIRVENQVSAEIVDKLLVMLPEMFAGFRRECGTIPVDNLGSLEGKVLFDLLDRLVEDLR